MRPTKNGSRSLGLPAISLELVEDLSPDTPAGFLQLVRRRFVARYPDGTVSEPFVYDEVDRKSLDATVIAAHFVTDAGPRHVFLRSAFRPPVAMRDAERDPYPLPNRGGGLWELPAGLVETHEQTPDGVVASAARELGEELGFHLPPDRLRELGPSTYPSPGVIAERHFFYEVEVEPDQRQEPHLDGSALERFGIVQAISLDDALAWCADGRIEDGKTELCLRRLRERYP